MKIRKFTISTAFAALSLLAGPVFAAGDDDNLSLLGSFKTTGTTGGEVVPQGGKYAENLRNVLQSINFPMA